MKRGRLKTGFGFHTTFYYINNLVPSPVRRGKVRMGGFAALGKIKFVQPIEPLSPQPPPARREREQAACSGIDFCPTTVIPAQAGILF